MIKTKLFIILLFCSTAIFPQGSEKKNPNVELPDFVITGKDVVSLQKARKLSPDIISTISEQFIKPVFSPEDLSVKDIPNPIQNQLSLTDSQKVYGTRVSVLTGIYTSPSGDISFAQPFSSGIFMMGIDGENHRAYIDNSEWYRINAKSNLSFYLPNKSSMQGTEINFNGNYGISAYRFYSSNNPTLKRTKYGGKFSAEIKNLVKRQFNFALKASDRYTFLNKENFSENMLRIDGYLAGDFSYFKLGSKFNYTGQFITNNLVNNGSFNFYSALPFIQADLNNNLKIAAGINYSKSGSNDYLAPYVSAGIKLNDFVSFFTEYRPGGKFYGLGGFLEENRYFNPQNLICAFVKNTVDLNAVLKYQYFTYFEIDAGIKYVKSDNMPYFVNSITSGQFDVNFSPAREYNFYTNILFHLGPGGEFYGSAEYNDVKNLNGNVIPYQPKIKASISYGYNFDFGLYTEPKIYFNSETYADADNSVKIDRFINLAIKFGYKFVPNFSLNAEISNILDRKNVQWNGYREAPLDLMAGFTYKW
ncbi:MAG: hypothetical protein WB996_14360 [Ignavibacteriaceae bacterium]